MEQHGFFVYRIDQFQTERCCLIMGRDRPAHVQKCPIMFGNQQPALSLTPALFHGVQVWQALGKSIILMSLLLRKNFPIRLERCCGTLSVVTAALPKWRCSSLRCWTNVGLSNCSCRLTDWYVHRKSDSSSRILSARTRTCHRGFFCNRGTPRHTTLSGPPCRIGCTAISRA